MNNHPGIQMWKTMDCAWQLCFAIQSHNNGKAILIVKNPFSWTWRKDCFPQVHITFFRSLIIYFTNHKIMLGAQKPLSLGYTCIWILRFKISWSRYSTCRPVNQDKVLQVMSSFFIQLLQVTDVCVAVGRGQAEQVWLLYGQCYSTRLK